MQQNSQFYNLWAQNYDEMPNSTIAADEMAFARFWVHYKDKKALEIGCGTGRHTQKLAQICNEIVAIELSENMLSIAKNKISHANVKFLHGDFLELEINDADFDFAITSLVIEHIENPAEFIAKTFKLLKPMGRFFISEIHPSRMANGSGAHFIDENNVEIRGISFAHSEETLENAAMAAGFEIYSKTTIYGTKLLEQQNLEWKKYYNKPMILIYELLKP